MKIRPQLEEDSSWTFISASTSSSQHFRHQEHLHPSTHTSGNIRGGSETHPGLWTRRRGNLRKSSSRGEEEGEGAQAQAQMMAEASSDGAAARGGGACRTRGDYQPVLPLEELTKLLKKCSRAFSLVRRRRLEDCWGEEARWPRKEPCGDQQRRGESEKMS